MLALILVLVAQRQTQNFDHGWRFHLGDVAGAQETAFDDAAWHTLDLPHDWSIEGEFSEQNPAGVGGGALPGGVGWYRKSFVVPRSDSGKVQFVEFDGVYRNSEVWINGVHLGKRPYGYSSFRYELTPHLRYRGGARNVIAVRVDNSQQPNSRWYSGSGIYRHVRLVTSDPMHVDEWGTYITTPVVSADSSHITIRTSLRNERHGEQPVVLSTVVYDSAGREVAAVSTMGRIAGDSIAELVQDLTISRAVERQLQIMRAMGVNALRTSHNPPAPELLDLTDRMGFIVMDEAFDMWKKQKTDYDYHLDWDAWHVRDLSDMVQRDRNHPSVFIWSIGNEVMEQWTNDDTTAIPIARELAGIVRRLDPTRPITSAANNGSPANPLFHAGALDLLGHNYHHEAWPNFPAQFPGGKFIITEAMSALNSRGVYEQPSDSVASYATPYVKDSGPQPNKDYRLSSYDDRKAFWGSLHEESLRLFERYPFLSGMFIWSGIDYLGEPTPYEWPARSSYFGVVDLAGFPKDPFYLYQSEWTARPMLHVFPHWTWRPGDTVDVWAYTNGDEVELFLNGASLGAQRKAPDVFHLMWRVAYTPGTLRAVARKAGQVIATQVVRTAGAPARIALAPDRSALHADGNDLSFVTVSVLDRAGVAVPTADQLVRLQVSGAARIAGVDNGDQISHAPFQADRVQLFNGKALVIVRAGERGGTATLTAEGEGLESARVRIELGARR